MSQKELRESVKAMQEFVQASGGRYLVERELICPVCDARAMVLAEEHERVERCPECGCAAELYALQPVSGFTMLLVWGTLISLCVGFWYALILWVTS